jgi:hypothetical protein
VRFTATRYRPLARFFAAVVLIAMTATAPAQQVEQSTAESDPITCWLKTTKTAVHIGEQFNLALTCAIVDTPRVAVVPDLGPVEPTTIQLAPFEVVGGTRHPDIQAGTRRYLQFEYTLRLIADSFFGQDVAIPAVVLKYVVQIRDGGAAQQGREKSYVLPVLPVRIISLVPQNASDIRDASRSTFADIETHAFRATVAYVVGAFLLAISALLLIVGIMRAFSRHGGKRRVTEDRLAPATIARSCVTALHGAMDRAASKGWTAELLGEALAALRIGAALALKRPVTQRHVEPGFVAREGQVTVRKGVVRPRNFAISAPITSATAGPFADALKVFTEARYGRERETEDAKLFELLEDSSRVLSSLRTRLFWRLAWTR